MLKTSYFAKSAKEPGAVSIARFPPKWYTGARYLPLAPAPAMLKIKDWDEYRRRYHEEVLSVLDPDKVLRNLGVDRAGHDIILLCFEKERTHCHRGQVAVWFHETRGITVPELGEESATQLPV
jgi:DNA-directed RNA polymerase subunit N (RpoN/RPB10)